MPLRLWCVTALLCCFSTTSNLALPTTSSKQCFPDAITAANRKNVSVTGGLASMPLKLASVTWVSGSLLHHAARILFREKLGYNVEFAPAVGKSRQTWMQVADCNSTNPNDKCFQGPPGSVAHLAFEIWESYASGMAEKMAIEVPGRVPFVVGELGALGTEAFFIRKSMMDKAAAEQRLFLDWYKSYDVSWSTAYKYFATHTDLPAPDTQCSDSSYMQGTYLDEYERLTGDSEAIVVDPTTQKKTRKCDANGWALSPACRKLMLAGTTGCIPAICYGGWGFHDLAQKAAFFDMPLALGAFGWNQYIAIPKANSTLTYWWTPDVALLNSEPVEVIFPRYDADEYSKGNYRSAMKGTKLQKISNAVIANEVTVQQLVKQMTISIQSVMKFAMLAEGRQDDEHEQIACDWLHKNTKIWGPWLPDPTECIARQGLMDNEGNFMTEANTINATKCQFCATGRRSEEVQTAKDRNFICKQCEAGRFQAHLGENDCTMCGAGRFQSEIGKNTCLRCPMGFYSNTDGATACTSCQTKIGSSSTKFPGASSPDDCVCMQGAYDGRLLHGSKSCVSCGEGLQCDQTGLVKPLQAKGYYIHKTDLRDVFSGNHTVILSAYRCRNHLECPSGDLGTCAAGRTGTGCGNCMGDHYKADKGKCNKCGGADILPLVLTGIALVVVLFIVYLYSNMDNSRQHVTTATCVIAIGQLACTMQALSVFRNLQIEWEDPILSILSFLNLLTFDLDVIKIQCLFQKDDPVVNFVVTLLVFPIFMASLAAITVISNATGKGKVHQSRTHHLDRYWNSVGLVALMVNISITVAVFRPFYCIDNPNGTSTMLTNPAVVCWDSPVHNWLSVLGIIGLIAYPVTILTVVLQMVIRFPAIVASRDGPSILKRYRFLLNRFSPDRYYWGFAYVLRNLLISLTPVIFRTSAIWQVVMIFAILIASVVLTAYLMPWRTRLANVSELGTCIGLCVFMLLAAFYADVSKDGSHNVLGVIIMANLACLLGVVLLVIGHSLWARFLSRTKYFAFLCHHKEAAASLARWTKMRMTNNDKDVFLDSDQLEEVDLIFDVVRSGTSNLLALLTKSTLFRPWCAGEITTAEMNGVTILQVACDDYIPPSDQELSELDTVWSDQQVQVLSHYGLDLGVIQKAFSHLRSLNVTPLGRMKPIAEQEETIAAVAVACGLGSTMLGIKVDFGTLRVQEFLRTSQGGKKIEPARIVVSGCCADPEARCTCEVLTIMMRQRMEVETAAVHSVAALDTHLASADHWVVVLTKGLLQDPTFSQLAFAFEASRETDPIDIVSVLAEQQFAFPPPEWYTQLEDTKGQNGIYLAKAFRRMLNILALPLSAHGSAGILKTQTSEICRRLRKVLEPQVKSHSAWDPATWVVA